MVGWRVEVESKYADIVQKQALDIDTFRREESLPIPDQVC